MQSADERTPLPLYGSRRYSQRLWTTPSSAYLPCKAMSATSAFVAAALPGGNDGLARSLARRHAIEDRVLRMPIPERVTLTSAQREAPQVGTCT